MDNFHQTIDNLQNKMEKLVVVLLQEYDQRVRVGVVRGLKNVMKERKREERRGEERRREEKRGEGRRGGRLRKEKDKGWW